MRCRRLPPRTPIVRRALTACFCSGVTLLLAPHAARAASGDEHLATSCGPEDDTTAYEEAVLVGRVCDALLRRGVEGEMRVAADVAGNGCTQVRVARRKTTDGLAERVRTEICAVVPTDEVAQQLAVRLEAEIARRAYEAPVAPMIGVTVGLLHNATAGQGTGPMLRSAVGIDHARFQLLAEVTAADGLFRAEFVSIEGGVLARWKPFRTAITPFLGAGLNYAYYRFRSGPWPDGKVVGEGVGLQGETGMLFRISSHYLAATVRGRLGLHGERTSSSVMDTAPYQVSFGFGWIWTLR